MKKLLLLLGLVVFLTPSLVYGDYYERKKQCILNHLLEKDNDRANLIIEEACADGVSDENAHPYYKRLAQCIFTHINKVPTRNSKAASVIVEACKYGIFDPYYKRFAQCVFKNISKAKSDSSAKSIGDTCGGY